MGLGLHHLPLSTIGAQYGNSVSTAWMPPKPTIKLGLNWLANAENQREKPIQNFSINPASSIRTSIADTVFADPVSETPKVTREVPTYVYVFREGKQCKHKIFRPDYHRSHIGCTPRGSCNRTLLRRVLRRFSNSKCFLEGFLEGACKGFQ